MIENQYFKENPRFEIEEINIPRLLLIKDNKLTNKTINTFKNIFNLFSIMEKWIKNNQLIILIILDMKNGIRNINLRDYFYMIRIKMDFYYLKILFNIIMI